MTTPAWGRAASALLLLGLLGIGWRLVARHERVVRPALEAGAAAVEASARPLRVQPLVCAEPRPDDPDLRSPQALAGASLVLSAQGVERHRWALGEVEAIRRAAQVCVSLPPQQLEEGGDYALLVEGGEPAALTLEVVESTPLGWLDWLWCWVLLASMGARLRGWGARPAPALDGGFVPWGRPHPALGLLVFVLAQGVISGGVLPLVARALRLAQASALAMLAQALVIASVHLGIVYGLARAEHPDWARARLALGAHAPSRGRARLAAVIAAGAALGIGANVMLALLVSGPSETSAMQEAVRMPGSMLALAAMATLSPWYEELFFRGYVQGALSLRLGALWAAVASAALFGLVHVPQHLGYLWPVVPIFAVSIAAAALRAYTGSTAAPFALHLGYNAALVLPAMLAP